MKERNGSPLPAMLERFVAQVDPTDSRIIYAESQDGRMSRIDRVTNERQSIRPEPPEGEKPYRWNWDTPILISPHNPATIFVTANRVFKSTDRGHSWKAISGDLTTNTDRDGLELMGVKGKEIVIARNDGVGSYGNIVTFAESSRKAGLYYAGSDDGVVSVSRDDGANWANVTAKIPGLPANTYVSRLAPSRFEEGTVYATFDGHRGNDFNSYVYVSRDYGQSWQSIVGDLPKGQVARTITEDLKNPELLYLGTETGLFASFDRGRQWMRIKANLPTVPIYEITLHPRDNAMLLATHGRSIWILDDLAPLQEFARARGAEAWLFEMRPAVQWSLAADRMREFEGDMQFLGRNPEPGAAIAYHLKAEAKALTFTITDGAGAVVREIAGEALKGKTGPGINVVQWDLRVEPLPAPRGPQMGGEVGAFLSGGLGGPLVLPGQYQVAMKLDGREVASRRFAVQGDPEITIAEADLRARYEAAVELHRMHRRYTEAAASVTALNERLRTMQQVLKENKEAPAPLRTRVEEFAKKFDPVGRRFGLMMGDPMVTGDFESFTRALRVRILGLKNGLMGATARPTETQARQVAELRATLDKAIEEANALIAGLPAIQKEMAESGLYPAAVKPIK